MTRAKKKELIAFLTANPNLVVTAHPNPNGLGPRRFDRVIQGQLVFMRPGRYDEEPSFLTISDDIKLTVDGFTILGFTIMDGRVVYELP